jgi:hypothetical protein
MSEWKKCFVDEVKDPLIVGLAAGKLVLLQRKAARQKMQKNKTKQKNRKSSPISTSLRRFQREKESLISKEWSQWIHPYRCINFNINLDMKFIVG